MVSQTLQMILMLIKLKVKPLSETELKQNSKQVKLTRSPPSLMKLVLENLGLCLRQLGFLMCVSVAQSCPTLCDLMNYSPPGSSVNGILQARMLEWGSSPP